jgi:hypothetical protein
MRKLLCLAAAWGLLMVACSRDAVRAPDQELADTLAEADEATAMDFSGPPLQACGLLSQEEVSGAIGALAGPPVSPPEDAADTAEARCVWHGTDDRALLIAASREGGTERLAALESAAAPDVTGSWEEARLQGCCLLHAVKEEAMLSLDFSAARIDLAAAAKLMDLALSRVHEPLESP